MRRSSIPRLQQIRTWTPSADGFQEFLQWLDEGRDSGGTRYLEMRRRLAGYFDRKNCDHPDDLADETLNRVMRRFHEDDSLRNTQPARYCYIVAKFVFLEHLRRPKRADSDLELLERIPAKPTSNQSPGEPDHHESLLACLDCCLQKLDPLDRALILEYYVGEQRAKIECRRQIAAKLGLTMNAISIRACRIRDKLEACMKGFLAAHE
jgi:RNA polymerase sigma factor (sigma-70 family)